MSPDTVIVAVAIGLTVGFLSRRAWRMLSARRKDGCAGGCGCSAKLTKK